MGVHLRLPAAAVGGAAHAVGAVDGRAAAVHRRCRVRPDQADRPGGPAGARRTDRVHPHGMVRASRRIGGGVRGRCATSRCPAGVHDRLQPRRRLLLDVGRAGAARDLQPTRAGCTPPARPTCADRVAAGSARCTAWTRCNASSVTWSSTPSSLSPGSRRRPRTRAKGSSPCAMRTPPWCGTPSTGSSRALRVELVEAE